MEDGSVKWFREEYPPAAALNRLRLTGKAGNRLNFRLRYPTKPKKIVLKMLKPALIHPCVTVSLLMTT